MQNNIIKSITAYFSLLKKQERKIRSKINGLITIKDFLGKKTLFVGDVPQSGGEFEYMWRNTISKIKNQKSKVKNCLILGVGGGTAIKYLKKYYPNISITGVEIDPVMVKIARNYFSLPDDDKTKIILNDAFPWVDNYHKKEFFDLIVVDLYQERLNPPASRKKGFLSKLKKMLKAGGLILFNAHYQPDDKREFKQFLNLCQQNFSFIEEVFCFRYNRVISLQ